ncbi:MAG: PadR family transcriptional regulator [Chloroflexota bacterium]
MVPELTDQPLEQDSFASLRRGLLEFAVLTVCSTGLLYAAEVLARLEGTHFATREGTLYPLFGKLRRDGLLEYEWQESDAGPPRKYYRLTEAGTQRLTQLRANWSELGTTLEQLAIPAEGRIEASAVESPTDALRAEGPSDGVSS